MDGIGGGLRAFGDGDMDTLYISIINVHKYYKL